MNRVSEMNNLLFFPSSSSSQSETSDIAVVGTSHSVSSW